MNRFDYVKPGDVAAALAANGGKTARFIAGGTNLLDLMKENVERPERLIDINALPLKEIDETADGGLRIGALATNADTAYHPLVEQHFPLLAQAILAGASPQLRNMATAGGNLMQRTRCYYFYDTGTPCNKRERGSGCPARHGVNRIHAILGASEDCIAVHPSDMCVALAALEATVHVRGMRGERTIAFADFHRLPGDRPDLDNTLEADEMIVALELRPNVFAAHSAYMKLRDRASYAFALVSVAAALDIRDGRIREGRVALGGVAHKPWRVPAAEALLADAEANAATFDAVAARMLEGARGHGANDFKIPLARRAIVRTLAQAARVHLADEESRS
jgi:xanthine dehydrogenase YagS FAD-binding subunit